MKNLSLLSHPRAGVSLLGLLLVAAWAYREVPELAYTGVDASTWVRGCDLSSSPGMTFVFASKHFVSYRPLTALSYALGRAVHGADPLGYQISDLVLHLACVAAAFGLGRRLFGRGVAATIAAGVVALHPIGMEAVPVLARRGDLLVTLLGTLALERALVGRRVVCSVMVALAMLAKEPAVVLPGLVFLLGAAHGSGSLRERGVRGLVWMAGPSVAVVAVLAVRLAVLGGLGGYPRETLTPWVIIGDFFLGLSVPGIGALFPSVALNGAPVTLLMRLTMLAATVALPIAAALLVWRPARKPSRPAATCAILGPVWLLSQLALYVASGTFQLRLLYPALVPLGLTVGWSARVALGERCCLRTLLGLGLLAPLIVNWIVLGPLLRGVGEWREASRLQRDLLAAVERALSPGDEPPRILVVNYPFGVKIDPANRRPSFGRASVFFDLDYTEPTGETGIQDLVGLTREDPRVQALSYVTVHQAGLTLDIEARDEGDSLVIRQHRGPYDCYGNPKLGVFGPPGRPIVYDKPVPAGTTLLIFDLKTGTTMPFPARVRIEIVP